MIPVDRIIKNQDLTDKKLNFEEMSVNELEYYYRRFIGLKNNVNLLNSLTDKGGKLIQKIETIEVKINLISTFKFDGVCFQNLIIQKCRENNPSQEVKSVDVLLKEFEELKDSIKLTSKSKNEKLLDQLDDLEVKNLKKEQTDQEKLEKRFQKLLSKIDDENARKELLEDLKSPENIEKIIEKKDENYFLLKNSPAEAAIKIKETSPKKNDLNDVKKKLIEKYKIKEVPVKAKTIPLKESVILIQEQTKRYQVNYFFNLFPSYISNNLIIIQELQMQQAAQKLLEGSRLPTLNRINETSRYR